MKRNFGIVLVILCLAFSACAKKTVVVKKSVPPGQAKKTMPPGQMKKLTGSKSAAPYAPGQQNKTTTAKPAPAKSTAPAKTNGDSGTQKKK